MKNLAPKLRRSLLLQVLILVSLTPGLVLMPVPLSANPHGQQVVAGNVNFQGLGTSRLDINNLSQKAIINWQSFSIQRGEVTRINQAGNATTLNRVVSGNPTQIYGQLKAANGNVIVVNPSGIVVGQGGVIDVAGMMTLSTLDVSNKDFLSGTTDRFRGNTAAGVQNYGTISSESGDVVLMGNFLQNAGEVNAPRGVVAFGAGGDMVVDYAGGATISVKSGGSGGEVGIDNSGTVNAAAAELKAHGNVYALAIKNDGIVRASGYNFRGGKLTLSAGSGGSIVNTGTLRARNADGTGGQVMISGGQVDINAGSVDASGAAGQVGGNVSISGSGVNVAAGATVSAVGSTGGTVSIASTGLTSVDGTVAASGSSATGGRVTVEGSEIAVGSEAVVDVSGESGGGTAMIGGGFQGKDAEMANAENLTVRSGALIIADAVGSGEGGDVILWSDGDTLFAGDISASGISGGGFAEISGKSTLEVLGTVDLTTVSGEAGTLLLDPTNITISNTGAAGLGGSTISNVWLSQQLDTGTNVVITTNFGSAAEAGNISVNGRVEWYQENAATTPGSLSLLAMGNINFTRSVRSAGTGAINVVAGWDGTTGFSGPGSFDMAAVLATMPGGASEGAADAAGLNGGSVFVNAFDGAEFVEVGSRFGATNIASHDLFVTASNTVGDDRWAQIGFHDSGYEYNVGRSFFSTRNEWWGTNSNAAGGQLLDGGGLPIAFTFGNVRNKNYVFDLGGTVLAGGQFQGAGYGATGAIEIGLSGRLDMRAADNRNRNYVQIGHGGAVEGEAVRANGGPSPRTTRDGFIMDPGQDNNRPYFGPSWRTNYLGHAARVNAPIKVTASEDIFVSAARGFEAGFEEFVTADTGSGDFALIGHGGYRQAASLHGDVTVEARGATADGAGRGLAGAGIQLRGNNGSGGFAQIGHASGGGANRTGVWDMQRSGRINVNATTGAIRLIGFNQLPRAGAVGDRNFGAVLDVNTPLPNNSPMDHSTLYSHVQIGHGQSSESGPATGAALNGNANLQGFFTAPATVTDLYNASNATFVNPGTSVRNVRPDVSTTGDISVFAGGKVRVRDNMGYDANGNWVADPGPGSDPYLFSGGTTRDIGIEVRAGNAAYSYGMIGHGGSQSFSLEAFSTGFRGDIDVEADQAGIMFVGGEEKRADRTWGYGYNFAQIGHGGVNVQGTKEGAISVLAGQGAGALDGDIIFRTGRMRQSYAQIGHGGQEFTRAITGDATSDIIVLAKGDVEFTSRISGPSDVRLSMDYVDWAMGETGSTGVGNSELAERVVGTLASGTQIPQSAVQAHNWDTNIKYAMIGHGGSSVNFTGVMSLNNTINVDAQEGNIRMTAGGGDRDFVQLGHGGYRTGGSPSITGADLTVNAARDIVVDASNPGTIMVERSSMLGIAERDASGNFLSLGQQQAIGRGFGSYGMIGNGGFDMDGDHSGNITVNAGRDITLIGPKAPQISAVTGYVAGRIEGPSNNPASGEQNYFIGTPHALDTLVEASQMQRTFQLYHGNGGASEPEHRGAIVPGTLLIDLGGTGGLDLRDAPNVDSLGNPDGTGTLYRTAAVVVGNYAVGTHGVAYGRIDYATGRVTVDSSLVTANNGDLENDRNSLNRNINYTYANPTLLANVAIAAERTPESDSALRPNEAFLGHGRILPGSFVLNVGGTIFRENPVLNGEIFNAANVVVGNVDYDTGRVRFRSFLDSGTRTVVNPSGLPVTADYQWADGNSDSAFVHLGNGGQGSSVGGRDTIGATGELNVTAGGNVRFHAGNFSNNYAQLGHGGTSAQSANSGNINLTAGGIVEFMAGNANNYLRANQYAQLGHGGFDADGSHLGDIVVRSGSGARSLVPGTIGGGALGGFVLTGGNGQDTYAMVGHGGRSSQAGISTQMGLAANQAGRLTGKITINSGAAVSLIAGTKIAHPFNNVRNNDDGRNFVQIGHGGWDGDTSAGTYAVGFGHIGDISVTAASGDIDVRGGSLANGSAGSAFGRYHWAQIGHGGYLTSGDHNGEIEVIAEDGSVRVLAGAFSTDVDANKYNFAQIGHGASDAPGNFGLADEFIKVFALGATGDVVVRGGDALRTGAQIGNGGYFSSGNSSAAIKVIAGNNLLMSSGAAIDLDDRSKIGHGDQFDRGSGTRSGDIHVSIGNSAVLGESLIGHYDYRVSPPSLSTGNTFIAVGRDNPNPGGPGSIVTTASTALTSAGGGIFGELRLYIPDSSSNSIAAGTSLNGFNYTRTPAPGSSRGDEQFAVEHQFPASGLQESDAAFTPEGDYPSHSFGLYNIYYGGAAPFVSPVVPPVVPPVIPPVVPDFDFAGVFGSSFDAWFRGEELFYYDGYDDSLVSIAYEDAIADESDPGAGGWLLEDLLDGDIGSDDERDEELERRKEFAGRKVGRAGITYFVFDPGSSRYSSYRVFGVPQADLSVTQ